MAEVQINDRVRFRSANDVIEGTVLDADSDLVVVRTDEGKNFLVDRYSLRLIDGR